VITKDPAFIREVEAFSEIDRLNIGPVSTMKISWDQPHEGNMFEFLWKFVYGTGMSRGGESWKFEA